jgi:predicted amidohydrolase
MRVATLQFNPQVGQIAANFSRAESLLMREEREGVLRDLELLVLPELAFTGRAPSHVSRTDDLGRA